MAARASDRASRVGVRIERSAPPTRASVWRTVLAIPLVGILWVLAVVQVANVSGGTVPAIGAVGLVTGLHTMPLLWSRFYPLAAWAPITLAAAIMLGSYPVWPLSCAVAMLVALYMVGVRSNRPTAVAATAVSVLAILPVLGNHHFASMPALLPLIVVGFLATLAVASNVGGRQAAERALAEREEEHRREQARRALLEERSRIARELHDVVAHHMSMIAVQAETAPYRIGGLPEDGRRDFAAIGATAREALTEMRRLLGVLRSEHAEADRAPQPGLERIGELVDGARKAGLPVRLAVHGTPRPLPTGIDLSAYRIVQEALSNAGRHARGAAVEVEVHYRPDRLEVIVTNDGDGEAAPPGGPATRREQARPDQPGGPAARRGEQAPPDEPGGHGARHGEQARPDQPGGPTARRGEQALADHRDGHAGRPGDRQRPDRPGGPAVRDGDRQGPDEPGGPSARRGEQRPDHPAGHGLLGMSERVAMLGGSLQAGPRPAGAFRVHATLPLEPVGEP